MNDDPNKVTKLSKDLKTSFTNDGIEDAFKDELRLNLEILKESEIKSDITDNNDLNSKLEKQNKAKGGEIHITDSIRKLIKANYRFVGHNFAGKYLDCGSMNGYIKSSLEISKL